MIGLAANLEDSHKKSAGITRLSDRITDSLTELLNNWFTDWLADWLTDWLNDCEVIYRLVDLLIESVSD